MSGPATVKPNLEVSASMRVGSISVPRRNHEVIDNHHGLLVLVKLIFVDELRHAAKVGEAIRSQSILVALIFLVLNSKRLVVTAETKRVYRDSVSFLQGGRRDYIEAEHFKRALVHVVDDLVPVLDHVLSAS